MKKRKDRTDLELYFGNFTQLKFSVIVAFHNFITIHARN